MKIVILLFLILITPISVMSDRGQTAYLIKEKASKELLPLNPRDFPYLRSDRIKSLSNFLIYLKYFKDLHNDQGIHKSFLKIIEHLEYYYYEMPRVYPKQWLARYNKDSSSIYQLPNNFKNEQIKDELEKFLSPDLVLFDVPTNSHDCEILLKISGDLYVDDSIKGLKRIIKTFQELIVEKQKTIDNNDSQDKISIPTGEVLDSEHLISDIIRKLNSELLNEIKITIQIKK